MGRLLDRARRAKGDVWQRRAVDGDPNRYVCGCQWRRDPDYGDVLDLCPLHREASDALARESHLP